ncbi:hypothetical protein, partial [Dysgonomonas capnocytophagoides]|uniref:hypothetical protein n=1 Tax=Dysgonomonas capnocytophagoides TaxID=45254 RepID=UPI00054E4B13
QSLKNVLLNYAIYYAQSEIACGSLQKGLCPLVRQVFDLGGSPGYPLHEESVKRQIDISDNHFYLS